MQSSLVPIRETCRDVAPRLLFLMIPYWFQMHYKACILNIKCLSVVHSLWIKGEEDILLNHIIVVELGPLKDVLLTHNVRVDEKVTITHAEVLLAGSALEALQMVNLVPHTHRHLKRSDPLFTGGAETVLAKKPEWMRGHQHVTGRKMENIYSFLMMWSCKRDWQYLH